MSEPVIACLLPGEDHPQLVATAVRMAELLSESLVLAGIVVGPRLLDGAPMIGWSPETTDPAREQASCTDQASAVAAHLPPTLASIVRVIVAPSVDEGVETIAEEQGAGLIVLGASHRNAAARLLAGDPGLGLVRHAPCAVMITAAGDQSPLIGSRAIGIAWNRSPEARTALSIAAELAARAGCALRIVHVLEPEAPLVLPPADPAMGRELESRRRKQAEADIAHAVEQLDVDVTIHVHIRDGSSHEQLRDASSALDLLVIGARRIGPIRRLVQHSVSESVLHDIHSPLLVIPTAARFPAIPRRGAPAVPQPTAIRS